MTTKREDPKKTKEKKNKSKENDVILKEGAYSLCPTHKVQFPRGAKCPRCA